MIRSALPSSPEDPVEPEMGSWLMRFGSAVGAGALGAIIATAPATLRLEDAAGVCSPVSVWALLIAATVFPMSLVVFLLRCARGGLLVLGRREDRVPVGVLVGWLGSTFVALAPLGALLRARTHHHALGGVVFAITGLLLSLLLALVWARVAAIARRAAESGRRAAIVVAAMAVGVVVALACAVAGLTRGAEWSILAAQSVKLVDGTAFALGGLVASGRLFANRRTLALLGPPLAAIVCVLGASSLRACPSLREALHGRAPAVSWMVGVLSSN